MSIFMNQVNPCPVGSVAYTIRPGDTLYAIAQRLGVTVAAITAVNPGINPNALYVGQQICVPGTNPTCTGTYYAIQPGENFYRVAARYGISLQSLLAANPGVDPNRLVVGETICVPTVPPVVGTPCCTLLQPIFPLPPSVLQVPIGAVVVRQLAMSTRAYTVAAEGLPSPGTVGNFDSYVCVLSLFRAETGQQERIVVRLVSSSIGNQNVTWAGSITATEPPVVGDTAEVRPANSRSGIQGVVLLRGDLRNCRT